MTATRCRLGRTSRPRCKSERGLAPLASARRYRRSRWRRKSRNATPWSGGPCHERLLVQRWATRAPMRCHLQRRNFPMRRSGCWNILYSSPSLVGANPNPTRKQKTTYLARSGCPNQNVAPCPWEGYDILCGGCGKEKTNDLCVA